MAKKVKKKASKKVVKKSKKSVKGKHCRGPSCKPKTSKVKKLKALAKKKRR